MINIFDIATIAPTDQSVYYLGKIFGKIGGILPNPNDGGPILLGLMFKVLNTAALSVGAMIVVYTTVAGLLSTASEGEFLGKKWSGTWVPIRTVLGIVGLFPSSGGYCAIQIIIMWLILQGVGLADTLWNTVLNLVEQGGSPYVTTTFPDLANTVQNDFKNLFTGLVCYETLAKNQDVANSPAPYLCRINPTDSRCGKEIPPFESGTPFDLGQECGGVLQVCDVSANGWCKNPKSINCVLCTAQHQALTEIIPAFDTIAKTFVQMDFDYQNFYYTSSSKTTPDKIPEWIKNFCTANKIENQCCVGIGEWQLKKNAEELEKITNASFMSSVYRNVRTGGAAPPPPANDPTTKCSFTFFDKDYFPNGPSTSGQSSVNINLSVLKDMYSPAILSYINNINFVTAAAEQYQAVLNGAYLTYLASLPPSATTAAWNREAKNNGWILAGMYYMQITQRSANLLPNKDNTPLLRFNSVPNPDTVQPGQKDIRAYRNNINVVSDLFKYIDDANNDNNSNGAAMSAISAITSSTWAMNSMLSQFMHDVSGTPGKLAENPLYKISLWGYNMMIVVQFIFALTLVLTTVFAAVTATNFLVVGTGMTSTPWYEGFKAAWGFTSPFLMLAMSALFSIGAVLGIYLPLIPYTIFLMGAVGWLMATIEAMVAGPIIALGILSPSGQHELLGKAEPAVMIIFNLILRPALMVFGMMASMLVAVVVVTMINQGFVKIAFNIIQAPGLVEGIFFMMAYTSLLVMALNKVFSLIHVIPEKVLTYIGGQAISYGESEGLQGMKQQMEGGASGISSGGKEAGAAPAGAVTKLAQDKAHEKSDDQNPGVQAKNRNRDTFKNPLGGGKK